MGYSASRGAPGQKARHPVKAARFFGIVKGENQPGGESGRRIGAAVGCRGNGSDGVLE